MGCVVSHSVSIASASRVREGILVALGRHCSGNQDVSSQSTRSWLTACFDRYDKNSSGFVSCDAVLNVVAELPLFRIQDWSADEVSQFCSFFFRGEEVERNFDYRLFLDYLFFPVCQHTPRIKLKKQIAVDDIFIIHEGNYLLSTEDSEERPCNYESVIIKQLDLKKFAAGTEERVAQLRRRVNELRLLSHPNLTTFQTTVQNGSSLYVIQEHHQICTLKTILESFGPMKEPTIRRYLLQILQALTFLHDHGVQHGNLTMQTAQIDSYGLLKLTDFGIRRHLLSLSSYSESEEDEEKRKTLPPEVLRDCRLWGDKTDVWCVGMLTLQMANGLSKYPPEQVFDQPKSRTPSRNTRLQPSRSPMKKQELESIGGLPLPECASKNLKCFVRACTQRDPRNRSSVKELLEMGFFQIDQTKETNEVLRAVCTDLDATMRKLRSSSPTPLRRKSTCRG
ncbi:Protein kinase domain [Phytophthora infestans]|uniref:Protein kinase domain n=1 Tax=Phytophthora infestans TaxID=4787 RepID=A0A8S9TGD2_PHYIN|nr:Protein kinase domain [Phytophthora infestans]KAI9981839.1 hypothetical protein PInf_009618 [Phytophthora infestans]